MIQTKLSVQISNKVTLLHWWVWLGLGVEEEERMMIRVLTLRMKTNV
jgi:hypothetical protein